MKTNIYSASQALADRNWLVYCLSKKKGIVECKKAQYLLWKH